MLEKLGSFDQSNNIDAIGVKMDGSVLEETSSFKMLGYFFLPNWVEALALSLLLELPPKKLKPCFVL